MNAEQILAFRLARAGLAERRAADPVLAAACPASDFSRDAALLALAARLEDLSRDRYERAVESGELVVAHVPRGAIHALAPADLALYGRALLASDDQELAVQLGRGVKQLAEEHRLAPSSALEEVTRATQDALAGGRRLDRTSLHQALRQRVRRELLPWCPGCKSHHVPPMLWRYATVKAGARLDSQRRYLLTNPGRRPKASEALRRFLSFYGPSTPGEFAEWAGLARPHAQRLWDRVAAELAEAPAGAGWLMSCDLEALSSPPAARGVRLIPPGDPYLQKPNRDLIAPEAGLRRRMFRPVASPGAVLKDGRLVGLWRVKGRGRKVEITVERTGRVSRADLEDEAERIAALRGAAEPALVLA